MIVISLVGCPDHSNWRLMNNVAQIETSISPRESENSKKNWQPSAYGTTWPLPNTLLLKCCANNAAFDVRGMTMGRQKWSKFHSENLFAPANHHSVLVCHCSQDVRQPDCAISRSCHCVSYQCGTWLHSVTLVQKPIANHICTNRRFQTPAVIHS
jgi:hypothetical protein